MDTKPNVVYMWGERNAHCPHYEECVDISARCNWQDWDCSKCPDKSRKVPRPDATPHSMIIHHNRAPRP